MKSLKNLKNILVIFKHKKVYLNDYPLFYLITTFTKISHKKNLF